MDPSRRGQLDGRRRRLLANDFADEGRGQATPSAMGSRIREDSAAAEPTRGAPPKSMEEISIMDRQARVSDLAPRNSTTYLLLFLAGLTVVAGLVALYAWMPELASWTSDGRVAAFDLDGEGSLAVWFSSMTLAAAALYAMLVYSVRRHRPDDYHGRYRIWLWAAFCWLVMSLDECASLHEAFKELMTRLTGQRLLGDGSLWWVIAYGLVLSVVGFKLLMETRVCRGSTAALLASGACYFAAVLAQLEWLLPTGTAQQRMVAIMVEEGCEMVGNLLLLLAMSLHARHVILEAEGRLTTRVRKSRRASRAASVESTSGPSVAKPAALAVRIAPEVDDDDDDDDDEIDEKPSRGKVAAEKAPAEAKPARSWWPFKRRSKPDDAHDSPPAPKTARRSDLEPAKPNSASRTSSSMTGSMTGGSTTGGASLRGSPQDRSNRDDDESTGGGRKMSKAERKLLRRQMDRERREGA